MLFYVTTLNLSKLLTEKAPKSPGKKSNSTTVVVVDALNHIDLMYKNYILNRLDNTHYDVILQSIMQKYYGKLYIKSTKLNKLK
jgi:hypothetical protein